MGITSALDRLKLVLQIQKHQSKMKGTWGCSVERVTDFLQRNLHMGQYVPLFEQKQIDGDLLLVATDEILQEIGIVSALDRLKIRIHFKREMSGGLSALAESILWIRSLLCLRKTTCLQSIKWRLKSMKLMVNF